MTLPASKNRILFASLLTAIVLLATSCGSSSDSTAPTPQIAEPDNDADLVSTPTDSASPETSAIPATSTPPITTDPDFPASDPSLGNSSSPSTSSPPSTAATPAASEIPDLPVAKAVATGFDHSCALHEDGTMSCWGNDYFGQLGIADDTSRPNVPVQVPNINEVAAIIAEFGYSCALHKNGTIDCFGYGPNGQLGNGDFFWSDLPVRVLDIVDAIAISAGGSHVCALHADGSVSCWGQQLAGADRQRGKRHFLFG